MKTDKNILIAFILNLGFSIFELFGGLFTNSISIISDSVHDMGDALSIGLSYFFEKKSKRGPDNKYTYGYSRYSVLGALITTVILLIGSILVIVGAINRIFNPVDVNYSGMIVLALIGLTVHFIAAYCTREGHSINQKVVSLHMVEDVLNWGVVLIGAIIMRFADISVLDPILSICVSLFIFINAIKKLKQVVDLFLEKIPNGVSFDDIKKHLLEIDGIINVHHIHIWSIDGFNNYATIHVVVENNNKDVKHKIREELVEHGISHVTIELEDKDEKCNNIKCDVKSVKQKHNHHH